MVNLGHNSKPVNRAYAKKAQVTCPPPAAYEHQPDRGSDTTRAVSARIVPMYNGSIGVG